MKPLQVKMSAFGSYCNEVVIDFTKIDHGIFLITGDTGAGKTTIFDAITYALYDQSSTGIKNPSMMRSQYADNSTPTFVELTFENRGEIYRIYRNPSYERVSRRKNKDGEYAVTVESAKAALYLPDGSQFPGKVKETNEKIQEIIGIGPAQFTQTVMLAQGEFMRLLFASSKDRKDIFSKIFDTSIYRRIQEKLRDRAKKIEQSLAACQAKWELYEKSIPGYDSNTAGEPAKSIAAKEEIAAALEIRLKSDVSEENKLVQQGKELEKEAEELNAALTAIRNEEALFERLERLQNQKEQLDSLRDEDIARKNRLVSGEKAGKCEEAVRNAAEAAERYELNERKIASDRQQEKIQKERAEKRGEEAKALTGEWEKYSVIWQKELAILQEAMPGYERQSRVNSEYAGLTVQVQKIQNQTIQLEEGLKQNQERRELLTAERERLKHAGEKCIELKNSIDNRKNITAQIKQLVTELDELSGEWSEYQTATKKFSEASVLKEAAASAYESGYRLFMEAQAGILAEGLEDGIPCPVCGAVHHPAPAKPEDGAPTQQQLDRLKSESSNTALKAEAAARNSAQKKTQFDTHQKQIRTAGRRILGDSFEAVQKGLEMAESELLKEQAKIREDENQLKQAENEKIRFQTAEAEIRRLEGRRAEDEAVLKEKRDSLLNLKTRLAAAEKELQELKAVLVYPDMDSARKHETELKNNLINLKERADATQEVLKQVQGELASLRGRLQVLEGERTRLAQAKEAAQKARDSRLEAEGFGSEQERAQACLDENTKQRLEAEVKRYAEMVLQTDAQLETLRQQTSGMARREAGPLMEALNHIAVQREACREQEKKLFGRIEQEKKLCVSFRKLIEEQRELDEQYSVAGRLDKTANGRLPRTAGLDFQTYIQRYYFRQMIAKANRRLTEMTSGEYQLRCREIKDLGKQGEVGLDLDVFSSITGKQRDVKTLSGGESFMAALSMALGMADIIGNRDGYVRMDMMFIDEGFGTLDEESRNQAIRILCGLAGDRRLIGIISHVTQLKEQIDRKLIVEKGSRGSKIRWEV